MVLSPMREEMQWCYRQQGKGVRERCNGGTTKEGGDAMVYITMSWSRDANGVITKGEGDAMVSSPVVREDAMVFLHQREVMQWCCHQESIGCNGDMPPNRSTGNGVTTKTDAQRD